MTEELKPCPFCGGKAEIKTVFEGMEDILGFMLIHICHEEINSLLGYYCFIKIQQDTVEDCVKYWNKRHNA